MGKRNKHKKYDKDKINAKIMDLEKEKRGLEYQLDIQTKVTEFSKCQSKLAIGFDTFLLVLPFIATATITSIAGNILGFGLPVRRDKIEDTKVYSMEYEDDEVKVREESYRHFDAFVDEEFGSDYDIVDYEDNCLLFYTPWSYEDGIYTRVKRDYIFNKNMNVKDLYYAVLNEDYKYITDELDDYKEETQVSNFKPYENDDNNKRIIKAKIKYLDEKDKIKVTESQVQNLIITLINLLATLGIGAFINHVRDFDYAAEVECDKKIYIDELNKLNELENKLASVDKKILTLKKKVKK